MLPFPNGAAAFLSARTRAGAIHGVQTGTAPTRYQRAFEPRASPWREPLAYLPKPPFA